MKKSPQDAPDQPAPLSTPRESPKKAWHPPELSELPPLTDLTLQTGDPIPGGGGVF